MKYVLRLLVITGLLATFSTPVALAHTLKIDGSVGVTAHVNPDDSPIAGQPSSVVISVTDRSGVIGPQTPCTCSVSLQKDGQEIQTVPFVIADPSTIVPITFPTGGTYKLVIHGEPVAIGAFNPFEVTFTYTASGAGSSNESTATVNPLQSYVPWVVIGVSVFSVILLLIPTFTTGSQPLTPKPSKGKRR